MFKRIFYLLSIFLFSLQAVAYEVVTEPIRVFEGGSGMVNSVAFSPDGRYVASGNDDNTIKLFDFANGNLIRTFTENSGFTFGQSPIFLSVVFSPDSSRILSGNSDKTIKLWNVETGELIRSFEGHVD